MTTPLGWFYYLRTLVKSTFTKQKGDIDTCIIKTTSYD